MYDKIRGTRKMLPISQVAQVPGFYADDIEVALNEHIEKPANAVLDRLRQGGTLILTQAERVALTVYIVTMLKRVPHFRDVAYGKAPQILTDTVRELKQYIETLGRAGKLDPKMVERRLAEADVAEDKYRKQVPANVVNIIENPLPSESHLNLVFSMEWRFLLSNGPRYFVASDNPAYFFSAFGLSTDRAELVFPLSSVLALHCSWQPNTNPGLRQAEHLLVNEFNNRVASGATRFIFYRGSSDWVTEAGNVMTKDLNRINW